MVRTRDNDDDASANGTPRRATHPVLGFYPEHASRLPRFPHEGAPDHTKDAPTPDANTRDEATFCAPPLPIVCKRGTGASPCWLQDKRRLHLLQDLATESTSLLGLQSPKPKNSEPRAQDPE